MRWPVFLLVLFFSCSHPAAPPESGYLVENVLFPLNPPLAPGLVQSRSIRKIALPADAGKITSARLKAAEIGNPDFPDLGFARSFRLFLVDTAGQMALIAQSSAVPSGEATVSLQPANEGELLRFLHQGQLDMVLELDNTLSKAEGLMLIGKLEFAYR
ncbi:MAG: hypothetical protein WA004_15355 [Saprospiraceae bacterium]